MTSQPSVVAIFCDDIREEKTGVVSVMGIMPDNVAVPKLPGVFNRLGLYARAHIPADFDVSSIKLRIDMPDGSQIDLGEIDKEVLEKTVEKTKKQGTPHSGFIFNAQFANIQVPSEGKMCVFIVINEVDYVAGFANILLAKN